MGFPSGWSPRFETFVHSSAAAPGRSRRWGGEVGGVGQTCRTVPRRGSHPPGVPVLLVHHRAVCGQARLHLPGHRRILLGGVVGQLDADARRVRDDQEAVL